jgi:hypothetical protein
MNYWKWSNGETYYKSPRKNVTENGNGNGNDERYINTDSSPKLSYDSAQNAIAQSLAFTDMDEQNFMRNNETESENNKREYIDNKISDRELISQRGTNPFSMQTSYVNDVVTRDMFLKPINTTQGRTKNQNKTEE